MLGLWFRCDLSGGSRTPALRDHYDAMPGARRAAGRRRYCFWWYGDVQQQNAFHLCQRHVETRKEINSESRICGFICKRKHTVLEPQRSRGSTEVRLPKTLCRIRV